MPPTTIAWCDHSINPIRARNLETGAIGHYCEKISPGCRNCYSSALQSRFQMPSFQEQRQPGSRIAPFLDTTKLDQVLRRKKPTKYFWADMSDLFGDWVLDAWIDQCFATMALTPQHTHMVLTKRPERMKQYLADDLLLDRLIDLVRNDPHDSSLVLHWTEYGQQLCDFRTWPFPNIWVGTSVENQAAAEQRIPLLLQVPAAIRFLSCEPLISPVTLAHVRDDELGAKWNVLTAGIDWVILGGESGTKARPCQLRWLNHVVSECWSTGTPVFVKQLGRQAYDTHEITEGRFCSGCEQCRWVTRDPKGADPDEWPLTLRHQMFPSPR